MSYRIWGFDGLDDPQADAMGGDHAVAPGKRTLTMSIPRSPVQRKAEASSTGEAASLPAPGGGAALPAPVRVKMEHAFGVDLSQVRVHEGPHVSSVQALAYTQGTDIHFAPGQYQPHSDAGQLLLGHELTHVVQQAQGRVTATTQAKQIGLNDDAALEREADEMGARAARGERVPMAAPGTPSSGAGAPLQRFGLGAQLDQVSESVARGQATRWAAPMQTAAELQQAHQNVNATPVGGQFALDDHASAPGQCRSVLMTDALRRALLEALRRRAMTRVVEVRAPFRTRLEAAHDAAGRRTIQDEMRAATRPFLDELRAHPGARYEGDEATQQEVLAAVELDAEGNAETDLATQTASRSAAGPRDHARQVGALPHGAWCGAFCYTTHRGAGLTEEARGAMHATGPHRGVDAFLDYQNQRQVIWSGTEWMLVQAYHAQRSSQRFLHRVPPPARGASTDFPTGLGIQPGDVVLIDNLAGAYADHITQCRTYDPSTGHLETIGGNEGGGEGSIGASAQSHRNRPINVVPDGTMKPPRVYGYGRFSIVDYEEHHYLPSMPADAHESPEAMAARPHRRH